MVYGAYPALPHVVTYFKKEGKDLPMSEARENYDKQERLKKRQLRKEYNAGLWLHSAVNNLELCLERLEQAQVFLQNDEEKIIDETMVNLKKIRDLMASRFNAHISTYNRNGHNSKLLTEVEEDHE